MSEQEEPSAQEVWLLIASSMGVTLGYVRLDDQDHPLNLGEIRNMVEDKLNQNADYSEGWFFARGWPCQVIPYEDEDSILARDCLPSIAVLATSVAEMQREQMQHLQSLGFGAPTQLSFFQTPQYLFELPAQSFQGSSEQSVASGSQPPVGQMGLPPPMEPISDSDEAVAQVGFALACPICAKTFRSSRGYRQHMTKSHMSSKKTGIGRDKSRRFTCHQCDRSFYQTSDLRRHMRVHDGVKPFQCTICEKRFTQRGSLYRHIKTTHALLSPEDIDGVTSVMESYVPSSKQATSRKSPPPIESLTPNTDVQGDTSMIPPPVEGEPLEIMATNEESTEEEEVAQPRRSLRIAKNKGR